MLHHVSVGVSDVERAAQFYDAVLGALGYKRVMEFLPYALAYGEDAPSFWVGLPHDQKAAHPGNGNHIGFAAKTKNAVHKFHETALARGGKDNGAPGGRPDYGPDYYGAFVIDLDGNKIEATYFAPTKPKATKAAAKKAAKKPAKKSAKKKSAKKKKAKKR
jgi:catechol 2,3-dioxygenase-like lactoylglutathione lyase family enzyme